jgi:Kef-type K+ transport system membrane component KefB
VRRSLAVLGTAAAVLVLGFLALFASGGSGDVSGPASLPALTTTTTTPTPTTVTTIVALRALDGREGTATIAFVTVPNVVGMTLAQATATLSAVGLGAGEPNPTSKPSGQSATGTILAQFPTAGSQAEHYGMVQLTISGY